MAGCSVPGQAEEKQTIDLLTKISGQWRIDFDETDAEIWGTGISSGNEMVISGNGAFSYYIGIGNGGTGQCVDNDGRITVEVLPYEEHSTEKEILTLNYIDENGAEQIRMNWHGEEVCWKRNASESADNAAVDDRSEQTGTFLTKDRQDIQHIVEKFADAFFNGDTENIRKYLADSFDGDITAYQGNGTAGDFTIKGLDTIDENPAQNGIVNISLEYRDNSNPDTLWYLTFAFVRQADEWKIMWYGVEA